MSSSERLDALDVFRGLTIATMILVSTPGTWDGVYPWLEHAPWNGWTIADLVFPSFLFAMGAAVPFAMARRRVATKRVHRHVLRRAVILFGLGLLLNAIAASPPLQLATFRIPGVLQRIAIVYVVVAWMTERWSTRAQAIAAAGILVGYWLLLAMRPLSAEDNFGAVLDRAIFDRHMLYPLWDPEGLVSTLPAVASALAGVFAGGWLRKNYTGSDTGSDTVSDTVSDTMWLWAAGAGATGVAIAWSAILPINKNLWTSSYALFAAGMATQVLAFCYWILDVRRWRRWDTPFVALGRNALAAYFLSVGFDSVLTRWRVAPGTSLKAVIYRDVFASWIRPCCGTEAASLVYALAYVALWTVALTVLHRRRIYIAI